MKPAGPPRRSSEAGFSLFEILTVMVVIGIVANIAIPATLCVMERGRATAIVADFKLVEQAAIEFHRDQGKCPRDAKRGRLPKDLRDYLVGKIVWSDPIRGLEYEWEYWIKKNGKPKKKKTGIAVGFSVRTKDRDLLAMIDKVYDGPFKLTSRKRGTFVIEPLTP